MVKRRLLGLLVFLMVQFGMSGCMDNSPSNSYGSNPNPPAPNTIAMSNATFTPRNITVRIGTTVTWRNDDGVVHTSTSDSLGVWDTGDVPPGGSRTVTFSSAGTFRFHCKYHSAMGMTGSVIVN